MSKSPVSPALPSCQPINQYPLYPVILTKPKRPQGSSGAWKNPDNLSPAHAASGSSPQTVSGPRAARHGWKLEKQTFLAPQAHAQQKAEQKKNRAIISL